MLRLSAKRGIKIHNIYAPLTQDKPTTRLLKNVKPI